MAFRFNAAAAQLQRLGSVPPPGPKVRSQAKAAAQPKAAKPARATRRKVLKPRATPIDSPKCPATTDDVAHFRDLCADVQVQITAIAEEYGVNERTITRWARSLGFPPRTNKRGVARGYVASKVGNLVQVAKEAVAAVTDVEGANRPPEPPAAGGVPFMGKCGPCGLDLPMDVAACPRCGAPNAARIAALQIVPTPDTDKEVQDLLQKLLAQSRITHSIAGLGELQRLLLQILIASTGKMRFHSYEYLGTTMSQLYRMIIYAKRVEADMPPNANPVMARNEAARQLLDELQSVLKPEEQEAMGQLLIMASHRLQGGAPQQELIDVAPLPEDGQTPDVENAPSTEPQEQAQAPAPEAEVEEAPGFVDVPEGQGQGQATISDQAPAAAAATGLASDLGRIRVPVQDEEHVSLRVESKNAPW